PDENWRVTVRPDAKILDVSFQGRKAQDSLTPARISSPPVIRSSDPPLAEVSPSQRDGLCSLPKGLSAAVHGRTVFVFYSSGPTPSPDWIHAVGSFQLRRDSGRAVLFGFVRQESSDLLMVSPTRPTCPRGAPSSMYTRW